jgi:hypothetical protein
LTQRQSNKIQKFHAPEITPVHTQIKRKNTNDVQTRKRNGFLIPKIKQLQPYRTKTFPSTTNERNPTTKFHNTCSCRLRSVTQDRTPRRKHLPPLPTIRNPTAIRCGSSPPANPKMPSRTRHLSGKGRRHPTEAYDTALPTKFPHKSFLPTHPHLYPTTIFTTNPIPF